MAEIGVSLILVAALVSFAMAFFVMKRATRLGLLAHPNERSSHKVPTPSGGGAGIVAGGTVASLLLVLLIPGIGVPVVFAGLLMAILGYWDDRKPIPPQWRLGAQVLLTGSMLAVLPMDGLATALGLFLPEWALMVGTTLIGVLFINLFNFMDGIDGLAGSEAVTVLLGMTLLAWAGHPDAALHPLFWWMLGVAAATVGFLFLNWPPARLFMGDVGSTWLGLMLGFFAFASISGGWLSAPQWLIMTALFWADSLVTLIRRLLRGEAVWQAHRRHAYQKLARRWNSHRRVTLLAIAINVLVLLPLGYVAAVLPDLGWALAVLVLLALSALCAWAGAGAPLDPEEQAA